jgi:hypothetical protein
MAIVSLATQERRNEVSDLIDEIRKKQIQLAVNHVLGEGGAFESLWVYRFVDSLNRLLTAV